jgi:hypothetical protein
MYKILGGDGIEYGPIPAETLRQWIAEGRANAQTQVLPEGAAAWVPLGSLPEFAGVPTPAPASAPYAPVGTSTVPTDRAAAQALAVPAGWALTIVGILGVLMCIGMIIFFSIAGLENNPMLGMFNRHPTSDAERVGQKIGLFFTLVAGIGWAAFIAYAGNKLRRLESWGLVMTAAIFCLIPCCGTQFPLCVLSAPVGIWVIVVICLSKVKPTFT